MRALAAITVLSVFLVTAQDALAVPHNQFVPRHADLAHRIDKQKRCKSKNNIQAATSTTAAPAVTSPAPQSNNDNSNNNGNTSNGSTGNTSGGTINVQSSCGNIGASPTTSAETGPNGSIDWLNCGINSGGWNPPFIGINDVVVKDLSAVLSEPNNIFSPCAQYIDLFVQHAAANNIPAIFLASFAMQESTCNSGAVGGAGEIGLMQITPDKCGGAPGGNCFDPSFNIATGAKYFADTLNSQGGSVLKAIGAYNGWHTGLTYDSATAARWSGCCRCQNNLDYLHQFLNGWAQNVPAHGLGKYFNLNVC